MLRFYNPDAVKLAAQLEAARTSLEGASRSGVVMVAAGNLLHHLAASGLIPPREPKREVV